MGLGAVPAAWGWAGAGAWAAVADGWRESEGREMAAWG